MAAILSSSAPLKSAGYFKLTPREIAALTEALITRMDLSASCLEREREGGALVACSRSRVLSRRSLQ
jgi:hypothetical protein